MKMNTFWFTKKYCLNDVNDVETKVLVVSSLLRHFVGIYIILSFRSMEALLYDRFI